MEIGECAFQGCESITSMIIPENVEFIGYGAFEGCINLKSITIPDGVTYISEYVFEDCLDLTIYGKCLSFAEEYAKKNNIKFSVVTDNGGSGGVSIPKSVQIKFDANGGKTATAQKTVTVGKNYGTLPVPIRTGYQFDGWYTAKEGGSNVLSSTQVKMNTNQVLYARWSALKYKVSFNGNKGKASAGSKTVAYGSDYGKLPTAKRGGYTHKGWFTASKGGQKILSGTQVSLQKNQTLYAQWSKVTVSKVSSFKLKNKNPKKMEITIKEVKGAKGYQIVYGTNSSISKNKKTINASSIGTNIAKLKKGTTYYVKVRAYKVDSTGIKIYGNYSKLNKLKIR